MKLRRQQLLRIVLGAVMIVLAAFLATVVRNALEQRNPENALPTMQVLYSTAEGTTPLPTDIVRMDTYDWNFLFWRRTGGGTDLEIWREIKGAFVAPNSSLRLQFSYAPKSVRVFIKAEESDFVEQYGELVAPDVEAEYTLRVEANWGTGKDVTYYAKIQIPKW